MCGLLSLPVVFYSAWIFFDGAVRALKARTLDMMVLVAVGAGWGYSLVVTLAGGGEVFYEAATVPAAFVLLGHWSEMRARGGANDAIRTLLDLAPPQAVVVRDGEPVEVPTSEVAVGDLLLIRPGAKIPTAGVAKKTRLPIVPTCGETGMSCGQDGCTCTPLASSDLRRAAQAPRAATPRPAAAAADTATTTVSPRLPVGPATAFSCGHRSVR